LELAGVEIWTVVHLGDHLLGGLLIAVSDLQDLDDFLENNIFVGFLGILEQVNGDLEKFLFTDLFDDL
jgi:hypothetical protein